jgi:DNA polymerase I - 3''-5'' exonuclease and polymerase domains
MKLIIDVETTGLYPYKGDRAFVLGTGLVGDEGFIGFTAFDLTDPVGVCKAQALVAKATLLIGHNIKFDLAFLRLQGFEWNARLWDTMVMERVRYNDHLKYTLGECGKRIDCQKDDAVKDWIKANKAYGTDHLGDKKPLFSSVPRDILIPYLQQDVEVTGKLFQKQVEVFRDWDQSNHPIHYLIGLESQTTAHLFELEATGMLIDQNYCQLAVDHIDREVIRLERKLCQTFGGDFTDSAKFLTPHFERLGLKYGKTDKGNASFTDDAISSNDSEIPRWILERRHLIKMRSTYFGNFLAMVNEDGRIRGSIRQSAAVTGRFSVTQPALQTLPTEDDFAFPIRRAFIAGAGYKLVSVDYANMELRFLADQAEAKEMVRIFQTGEDFHQRVADMAKVPRQVAKSALFAKCYGAGIAKIAATLDVPEVVARKVNDALNTIAPENQRFSYSMTDYATTAPYTPSWSGRRYHFRDKNFAYKIANYLIQGGSSDVMRVAIINCMKEFKNVDGIKLLMTVHDELLFEVREDIISTVIPIIRHAMISAYVPKKTLDMDVSVSVGDNWHDLEDWKNP